MKTKVKIFLNTISIALIFLSCTLFLTYLFYTVDVRKRSLMLQMEVAKFIMTIIDERVQALRAEPSESDVTETGKPAPAPLDNREGTTDESAVSGSRTTGRIDVDHSLYRDIVDSVADYFDLENEVHILIFYTQSGEILYPLSGRGLKAPPEVISGTSGKVEGELVLQDKFGYWVRYAELSITFFIFSHIRDAYLYRNQLLYILVGLTVVFTLLILFIDGKLLKGWNGFLVDMKSRFMEVIQGTRTVPGQIEGRYGAEIGDFLSSYNSMAGRVSSRLKESEEKLRSLFKQRDNLKKMIFLYKKYIPYKTLLQLNEHTISDVVSRRQEVTSLSIELVDYLEPTNELYPEVITKELDNFHSYLKNEVIKKNGIINYSRGYYINVVYGVPRLSEKSFVRAVSGAGGMLKWVNARNNSDKNISGVKWRLQMGLSHGNAVTGIVGESYMVLGDIIERSDMMLEKAKYFGITLVTDEFHKFKGLPKLKYRKLDIFKEHAGGEAVDLFELFLSEPEMIDQAIKLYTHGLEMFYEERYEIAISDFKKVNTIFHGDNPSKVFLQKCEELLREYWG